MSNFYKGLSAVIVLCFFFNTSLATKRKVLFIGNSYTYTNNMPLMLQTLATSKGDTLIYDESDPGGYTFNLHTTNATTISKIFSQPWDIVVLQEQSQMPAFPPSQVLTDVYPYAQRLDSMIRANNSCTQTMFMMTWGHANGDPSNCGSYPVICTYAGMQQRLRESYLQMTQDNNAIIAPVGMAFKKVMDSVPSIWLFSPDSSHPAVAGSYLEACVMYSSIFHKKTNGASYLGGLTTTVANKLQQVSDRIVFDSLSFWQQYGHYPYAGFTYTHTGSNVTFSGHSPVPVSNYWAYGDGGHDTTSGPTHLYASATNYVVSHTVTTTCFTETLTDTVKLSTTGFDILPSDELPLTIQHHGNGAITFEFAEDNKFSSLEVYDASGRLIKKYSVKESNISDNFIPGLYIYRVIGTNNNIRIGKLVVY